MKKRITAAFAAAIMILAAAGCNGGKPATTTAASASQTSDNSTSQVAYASDEVDTSAEALEYLRNTVPLFANYLDTRRKSPLSFETTVQTSEGEWKSCVYIKDARNAVLSTVDPSGAETRTVYAQDKCFQLDSVNKKAYVQTLTDTRLLGLVDSLLLKLRYSEVIEARYTTGTGTIQGTEYDCESIGTGEPGNDTVYYFDKNSRNLVYIKDGDALSKVLRIENVFDKDDMLSIPADYEQLTYQDLVASDSSK